MTKKRSESSASGALKRRTTEDLKKWQWTEAEKRAVERAAMAQAIGDDSGIDFSDIPPLSGEQLSDMVQLRRPSRSNQ